MFCCVERSFFLNDWDEARLARGVVRMATGEVRSGMAALMGEGACTGLVPGPVSLRGI